MNEPSETAHELVARLAEDEWPDPGLLRAILEQGERAFEPLLAVVEAYPNGDEDGAIYLAASLLALIGTTQRAIPALAALLRRGEDDLAEWLCEQPSPLWALGPEAIPPLLDVVRDESLGWYPRALTASTAIRLAGDDPVHRAAVAETLRVLLAEHVARAPAHPASGTSNDEAAGDNKTDDKTDEMTGSLVCDLAELADPEAPPLINAALAAGLVDPLLTDAQDVDGLYQRGGETDPPVVAANVPGEWLDWYAERRETQLREERERARRAALSPLRTEARPMPVRVAPKPGRNDPCWCGSGKKYKKCHLIPDQQERR